VDELDSLLGVLQPYEALFCLDVLERSVRDMLTTVPWQQADAADVQFWKELPVYQPLTSTNVQYDENDPDTSENYIVDEASLFRACGLKMGLVSISLITWFRWGVWRQPSVA
jgi:hypothetical protein